jgi:hypothetical protein
VPASGGSLPTSQVRVQTQLRRSGISGGEDLRAAPTPPCGRSSRPPGCSPGRARARRASRRGGSRAPGVRLAAHPRRPAHADQKGSRGCGLWPRRGLPFRSEPPLRADSDGGSLRSHQGSPQGNREMSVQHSITGYRLRLGSERGPGRLRHFRVGRPARAWIVLARMPASPWPSRRQEANDADPAE